MEPTVIDSALSGALAAQYPHMLSLDLRSNNIVSIQDLRPLRQLYELNLDGNQLLTLDGLAGLERLTLLSARSNLMTQLGDSITTLSSLRVLDLAWNRLAAGSWVRLLASLPQLVELDVRGNPVCDLEGSQQLLAAALPGLQRVNGVCLDLEGVPSALTGNAASGGARPHADTTTLQPYEQQPQQHLQQAAGGVATGHLLPGRMEAARMDMRVAEPDSINTGGQEGPANSGDGGGGGEAASVYSYQPTEMSCHLRLGADAPHLWPQILAPLTQSLPLLQHQQDQPRSRVQDEAAVLRPQLEAATRAHEALLAAHQGLLRDQERLVQRSAYLEDALRRAEADNEQLQLQVQQDSTSSAQQVAGLASQVATLLAERDAAVHQAELLASRLSDAETRAAEAAQAAHRLTEQAAELRNIQQQLQQELAATQGLLLQHHSATQSAVMVGPADQVLGSASTPRGNLGPEAAMVRAPGPPRSPGASSHELHGGSRLEVALQQRVEALQQIVRMQERELVRLGALVAGFRPTGGSVAAPGHDEASVSSAAVEAGWENVLQPWREQVQALQEEMQRLVVGSKEQRAEWGQQLVEMREQFTQARTLLEALEQRSREQRYENAQLQAKISQLGSALQQERHCSAGLGQQVATRDAAAQAVKHQLLAFKAHIEQRETALEARAEQLRAHAERLSHAKRRLIFAFNLAAWRCGNVIGSTSGSTNDIAVLGATLCPRAGPSSSHVALQGRLAASPAAKIAAASVGRYAHDHVPWAPSRGVGLLPRGESEPRVRVGFTDDSIANKLNGGVPHEDSPLVAVLRQEINQLAQDRQMLLQQLAQVSSSAGERIRMVQTAIRDREARQQEALLETRLQAAQKAMEGDSERKVQAAEALVATQADRVRRQVQTALETVDELCRRTEAAAGIRLSKMAVRLQDLAHQVLQLRNASQRDADELRCAHRELTRLRQEVAEHRANDAELHQQLATRDREAHARLAELKADQEEALAAERRRTADAERAAAKSVAECGHLERQLARMREVRAQQEDARLRRVKSQVHEQDVQLRSLRRERNALLAELRKQQGQQSLGQTMRGISDVTNLADTAIAGNAVEEQEAAEAPSCANRGCAEQSGRMEVNEADTDRPHIGRPDRAVRLPPPLRKQQLHHNQQVLKPRVLPVVVTATDCTEGVGCSISRILKGGMQQPKLADRKSCPPSRTQDVAGLQDASTSLLRAGLSRVVAAAEGECTIDSSGPGNDGGAVGPEDCLLTRPSAGISLQRLTELEALTAELLSLP